MPALLVDTSTRSSSPSTSSTPSDQRDRRRSQSPSQNHRPPVSPISPILPAASPARIPARESPEEARRRGIPIATFRPQPDSLPINESENPDAIALRSAISLLQLQREKSKRDLKALEDLKAAAVSDPQSFVRSLQEQRAKAAKTHQDVLTHTLSDITEAARAEGEEDAEQQNGALRKDSAAIDGPVEGPKKFPEIPSAQNIIRCPPVNWAKYHVVGESLDKMHEEQKRYPGASEPPRTQQGTRAPPHAIAAPYSPFTDGVGPS